MISKFTRFAEEFLTSKKGDPQHNPTVSPCLVRVPGTTNLKCSQEVKVATTMGRSKTGDKLSVARFQKMAN